MPMKLLCIGPYRVHTIGSPGLASSIFRSEALRHFLREALETRRATELPPPWDGLQARATEHDGGLSVRVSAEAVEDDVRDRFLWRLLTALVPEQCLPGDPQPTQRRWCAWIWHAEEMNPDEIGRLQIKTFVHAISKAWIEQMASTVRPHRLLH